MSTYVTLLLLSMIVWSHNADTSLNTDTAWESVFTLDGDLGIGGGPPGLRLWLDASFTLTLSEWERYMWRAKQRYRQITETVSRMANNVRERSKVKKGSYKLTQLEKLRGMLYKSPRAVMQEKESLPSLHCFSFHPSSTTSPRLKVDGGPIAWGL